MRYRASEVETLAHLLGGREQPVDLVEIEVGVWIVAHARHCDAPAQLMTGPPSSWTFPALYPAVMELNDRVVVVTGGGSGIGEAIAVAAKAEGARHVVVADLDGAQAARVAALVGGTGVQIDVRDESAIQRLVNDTEDAHGPIDLFVSNAGYVTSAGLEDPNASIQRMWEVHCMAHI